jgi:diacylglycerol kinase family enzyme
MLFSMARLSGGRPRVGRRGAHLIHDLDHITVIADEPMPFQVDGDALDSRQKVSFRSVANAIQVVGVPGETA